MSYELRNLTPLPTFLTIIDIILILQCLTVGWKWFSAWHIVQHDTSIIEDIFFLSKTFTFVVWCDKRKDSIMICLNTQVDTQSRTSSWLKRQKTGHRCNRSSNRSSSYKVTVNLSMKPKVRENFSPKKKFVECCWNKFKSKFRTLSRGSCWRFPLFSLVFFFLFVVITAQIKKESQNISQFVFSSYYSIESEEVCVSNWKYHQTLVIQTLCSLMWLLYWIFTLIIFLFVSRKNWNYFPLSIFSFSLSAYHFQSGSLLVL